MFDDWAQAVVSKPWAFVTSVLFWISKASGYRVLNHAKCIAWQKSVGVRGE
jgi:hypothetical protein